MTTRGKINQGKDFNFFQRIQVTNTTFSSDADVLINIKGQQHFSMINEGMVEYSFNGNVLHGDMVPGTPSVALTFDDRRVSKVWFRSPGGGSNEIRFEAWAKVH